MGYLFLIVFAAVGLAASVGCHALGWLGIDPPGGKAVFALHVGVFVVWIPLVVLANRTMPTGGERDGNLNHLVAELPRWVRAAMIAALVYAVVNFVLYMVASGAYPKKEVPFTLQMRGFSGHLMMFYGWAVGGFVALRRLARKRQAAEVVSAL